MHVIHIVEEMSAASGGVAAAVTNLSENLKNNDIPVTILHTSKVNVVLSDGINNAWCPPSGIFKFWKYSRELKNKLVAEIDRYERKNVIIHIHGVWNAPQLFSASIASKLKIPFILSFHGMIEPWLWNNQGYFKRWKKNLYWAIFARPRFRKSNALHAITKAEEKSILIRVGQGIPIVQIKNTIPPYTLSLNEKEPLLPNRQLLFLGRIDRVKGLHLLVEAFLAAKLSSDWKLVIAGPSYDHEYEKNIKKFISNHKTPHTANIEFVGAIYGDQKIQLLKSSWALIAPSYTEMLGLVNLESAAVELPSITTYQTGLDDWEHGGGLLVNPSSEELINAIRLVVNWNEKERISAGKASKDLVMLRYVNDVIFPNWLRFYSNLNDME